MNQVNNDGGAELPSALNELATLSKAPDELEHQVELLEAHVQRLKDIEEIRMLRFQYHEYVCEGRSREIEKLFTSDGEFDFGFMSRGNHISSYFGYVSVRSPFFKQLCHAPFVEVIGDTGRGWSYQTAISLVNKRAVRIAGRYDDDYRRTESGWKFRKMRFTIHVMMIPTDQSIADPYTASSPWTRHRL